MTAARMPWPVEDLWLQLRALLPGISVEVLPSVPSTSSLLMERVRSAADLAPCLLVAEQQTQGRGRMGRAWLSEAGASLTFSLALPLAPADWSGLSLAVGLALADALDAPSQAGTPRIALKWPNDLWLLDSPGQGRKLGGILIETVGLPAAAAVGAAGQRMAVIGIGLNVLPLPPVAATDAPLSQGHASLSELDAALDAPQALARVAAPLLRALLRFEHEGFAPLLPAYARRDVLRGRRVDTTLPGCGSGQAEGVDEQGALLLRQPAGTLVRVNSGEVSVRLQPRAAAQGAP